MSPVTRLITAFTLDLILPLTVGYLLRHRHTLRQQTLDRLMVFTIVGPVTVITLLSFWVIELSITLLWLPILGVLMQLVPGALSFVVARGRYTDPLDKGSFVLATMLSNRGTVGILPAFVFFGEAGYAAARLVMLLAPLVVYFGCYPMARYYYHSSDSSQGERPPLLRILLNRNQVPVLGILAGLGLHYGGVERPEVLDHAFPYMMHATLFLLIMPIGYSIRLRRMRRYARVLIPMFPVKFIITPAAIYLVARLVGLQDAPLYTVTILAASPTAINAVIAVRLHKLNVDLVMAAFVLTTAAYLLCVLPAMIVIRLIWG